MPAIRFSRALGFERQHIRVMQRAFDAICTKLQLSVGTADKETELVALRIIDVAEAGERNADRLTARVLAEFGVENDGSLWRH